MKKNMNFLSRLCVILLLFPAVMMLSSCGGGGSGSGSGGTGELSLDLTDATTLDYEAVYVTIDRVDVHLGDDEADPNNWKTVAEPYKTYNLLELVNGVREHLGLAELQAGNYTQMRLIIGSTPDEGLNLFSQPHPFANYVVLKDNYVVLMDTDKIHELMVPSGPQTGIKLVHGFTIKENQTTELILDFDANRSVVKAGDSGIWLLKPTINVVDTKNYAIVSGTVENDMGAGIEGAMVSAQIYYDPDEEINEFLDLKDQVVVWTSTVTDESGEYKLFLEPGTYNIVAYAQGYQPHVLCPVNVVSGEVTEGNDFSLDVAAPGTISGEVSIQGAEPEQHATISFRQSVVCDGIETRFEVISVNISDGGDYSVILSVGEYEVVASSYQKKTVLHNVTVSDGLVVTQNILLENEE